MKFILSIVCIVAGGAAFAAGFFGIIDSSSNSNAAGIVVAMAAFCFGGLIFYAGIIALRDRKKEDRESCDRGGSNRGVVKSKKEESNNIGWILVGILCVVAGAVGFTLGLVGIGSGGMGFPGGMVGGVIAIFGGIGLCGVGGIAFLKGGGDFSGEGPDGGDFYGGGD